MACGTPVVVSTLEEMTNAVMNVSHINPARCREHVELRFDVPRMVDNYLLAYNLGFGVPADQQQG